MSSKKKVKKNNQKHFTHKYSIVDPEEEKKQDGIAMATEATVHYLAKGNHFFGKKRTSRKQIHKRIYKQTTKRRQSRSRSFGLGINEHFKNFLGITLFVLLRSAFKGQPQSKHINNDLSTLEQTAISTLTITSILELIEKLVGRENRDNIILAYTLYSIGSNVVDLV